MQAMLAMAENLSALPLAVDQLAFEMSASNEEDETPAYAESVNHSGRAAPKRLAQPRMEERTRRSVPFGGGGIDSGSEESLGALREEIGMRRRSDKRGARLRAVAVLRLSFTPILVGPTRRASTRAHPTVRWSGQRSPERGR